MTIGTITIDVGTVITSIVSSGIVAATISKMFEFHLSKKLGREERNLGKRAELYAAIQEALAGFFKGISKEKQMEGQLNLPILYRSSQIWASPKVMKQFSRLINVLNLQVGCQTQDEIDIEYRKLVVEMRKDLCGDASILTDDIEPIATISRID